MECSQREWLVRNAKRGVEGYMSDKYSGDAEKFPECMQQIKSYQSDSLEEPLPVDQVEEAWFWFANPEKPQPDSISLGHLESRRSEFFRCVDRLYRHRRLTRDHLNVLAAYGRRRRSPQVDRRREQRSHVLWSEAMGRIGPALRRSGLLDADIDKE